MIYDVHLEARTPAIVRVEAADRDAAAELAEEMAYDEVHEVDRSTWRTVHVVEVP